MLLSQTYNKPKRININFAWRRYFLYLLFFSLALQSYLLPFQILGVSFYLSKVLLLMLGGLAIIRLNFNSSWTSIPPANFFIKTLAFWVVWGFLSLIWTPDRTNGTKEMVGILLGAFIGYGFLNLQYFKDEFIDVLATGWTILYLTCLGIAFWELYTGNHLESYFSINEPDYALLHYIYSTMGNPNNFAALLVLAWPYIVWWLQKKSLWLSTLLTPFVVVLTFVLIVYTDARLALMAFSFQLFLVILFDSKMRKPLMIAMVFFVLVLYLFSFWRELFSPFWDRASEFLLYESLETQDRSTYIRTNLFLNGIFLLWDSKGIGVGAGGFESYMVGNIVQLPYSTLGIVNPHNLWIQIASQHGLVILLFFIVNLFYWAKILTKTFFLSQEKFWRNNLIAKVGLLSLAGYIFVASSASSYISDAINWLFLSSTMVISCHCSNWLVNIDNVQKVKSVRYIKTSIKKMSVHS